MKYQHEEIELETDISNQTKSNENIAKDTINHRQKLKISNDDSDEDDRAPPLTHHKTYGNLVMIRPDFPHLSLGPDYCCFIAAFLAFSTASYFLIRLVLETAESPIFKIATVIICAGQPLSYLLVALSNPGVITKPQRQGADTKMCTKCQMLVPRHARHCADCDLCVSDYDHHCPWVSKCIGGNNLTRFYIFLGMTPIYFIFMIVSFVVCMSNNVLRVQQLAKSA